MTQNVKINAGQRLTASVDTMLDNGSLDPKRSIPTPLIFTGTDADDFVPGGDGNNMYNGGAGNDTLFGGYDFDTLVGGEGSDDLDGNDDDDLLDGQDGEDTLEGGDGNDQLYGGAGNDLLYGGAGSDTLYGGEGDDMLAGDQGNDWMVGGGGNDTFVVNSAGDVVSESIGEGRDTVRSSISYDLGEDLEILILTGTGNMTGNGNGSHNAITGNAGDNTLSGGGGNDTINGGAGADWMLGDAGDDTFIVDNTGDLAVDALRSELNQDDPFEPYMVFFQDGIDTVKASVSYTISENIEILWLTSSAINGTGNALDNTLRGNDANNTLAGLIGNDTLFGGLGNDTLDGGVGNDTLIGGFGDDTFVVDMIGDKVFEVSGQGTDTVLSSINYTLGINVENLTLTGSDPLSGTGNALGNVITGNLGNNRLTGAGGNDALNGGAGNDLLNGGAGNDTLYGGADNDTLYAGLDGDDQLYGDEGNDILIGSTGADTLAGGANNDRLTGGAQADAFVFNTNGGVDRITDFASGSDHIQIAATLVDILGGTSALTAQSFYAADGAVAGHDADDRLIYNTRTGALYCDADGSNAGAAVQIAVLDRAGGVVPVLQYADFIFG